MTYVPKPTTTFDAFYGQLSQLCAQVEQFSETFLGARRSSGGEQQQQKPPQTRDTAPDSSIIPKPSSKGQPAANSSEVTGGSSADVSVASISGGEGGGAVSGGASGSSGGAASCGSNQSGGKKAAIQNAASPKGRKGSLGFHIKMGNRRGSATTGGGNDKGRETPEAADVKVDRFLDGIRSSSKYQSKEDCLQLISSMYRVMLGFKNASTPLVEQRRRQSRKVSDVFSGFSFGAPLAVNDTMTSGGAGSARGEVELNDNASFGLPAAFETTSRTQFGMSMEGFEVLNEFTILDELAFGSTSTVMLAVHSTTQEPYAIKSISRDRLKKFSNSASNESTAQREIAIMKKLRHPNIVSLHKVIEDLEEKRLFLVIDYIPHGPILKFNYCPSRSASLGNPLGDAQGEGAILCETLPLTKVSSYALQIAEGLHYLHRHNVMHHDIKPDNLLLGYNDRVYITDFGVSEICDDANGEGGATHLASRGTPAFFAPEICKGEKVGFEADVWAFGVTIYAMIFGTMPFAKATPKATMDAIVEQQLVFPDTAGKAEGGSRLSSNPSSRSSSAPPQPLGWIDVIKKLLEKDPKNRMTLKAFMTAHPFLEGSSLEPEEKISNPNAADPRRKTKPFGSPASLSISTSEKGNGEDDTETTKITDEDIQKAVTPRNAARITIYNHHKVQEIAARRMSLGFQQELVSLTSPTHKGQGNKVRRGTLTSLCSYATNSPRPRAQYEDAGMTSPLSIGKGQGSSPSGGHFVQCTSDPMDNSICSEGSSSSARKLTLEIVPSNSPLTKALLLNLQSAPSSATNSKTVVSSGHTLTKHAFGKTSPKSGGAPSNNIMLDSPINGKK